MPRKQTKRNAILARSADHVDAYVGQRLRQLRQANGMSQTALAEKLNISFQQVQTSANGTHRIGSGRLWHISKALDVPISYFYEGLEDAGTPDDIRNATVLPKDTLRVARQLNELPEGQIKQQIFQLVKACSRAA